MDKDFLIEAQCAFSDSASSRSKSLKKRSVLSKKICVYLCSSVVFLSVCGLTFRGELWLKWLSFRFLIQFKPSPLELRQSCNSVDVSMDRRTGRLVCWFRRRAWVGKFAQV